MLAWNGRHNSINIITTTIHAIRQPTNHTKTGNQAKKRLYVKGKILLALFYNFRIGIKEESKKVKIIIQKLIYSTIEFGLFSFQTLLAITVTVMLVTWF